MCLVHEYAFSEGGQCARMADTTLDRLAQVSGWGPGAVTLARAFLSTLLVKVVKSSRTWRFDMEREEWEDLYQVRWGRDHTLACTHPHAHTP